MIYLAYQGQPFIYWRQSKNLALEGQPYVYLPDTEPVVPVVPVVPVAVTGPGIENISYNSPDGCVIGKYAYHKVSFYGVTPVVQRATNTTHTTTNVVTSASYGTTQVAQMQEVMNTLIALGLWAS